MLYADETKSYCDHCMTTYVIVGGSGANSGVAGYWYGGYTSGWADRSAVVQKMLYATEAVANTTALPSKRGDMPGCPTNSGVASYICGGSYAAPDYYTDTIQKNAFPSDTMSTMGITLSTDRNNNGAFANFGVKGYVIGGHDGSALEKVTDTIAFPAETRSTTTSLNRGRNYVAGVSSNGEAGYACGGMGYPTSSDLQATVEKFAYPSDTRTELATGLNVAIYGAGGIGNSGIAGYIAGGYAASGQVQKGTKYAWPSDTQSTDDYMLVQPPAYTKGHSNEGIL
jgi:hypothetical protein